MASTNKTSLGLSQWIETDPVQMEDFNENNEIINSVLEEFASSAVKIISGSYVGTGTVGSSNVNSLTFEVQPKILFIQQDAGTNKVMDCMSVFVWGNPVVMILTSVYGTTNAIKLMASYDGNTVSWYQSGSNYQEGWAQLNQSNYTYRYIAFC